jgi:bacteriorhodopsin
MTEDPTGSRDIQKEGDEVTDVTEVRDDGSLDFRFWAKVVGVIILGGAVAMIVFGLIGWAWYTWGLVGMFIFFCAILLGIAWFFDHRAQKQAEENRALLSE